MSAFAGSSLAFGLSINARDNTAAARQSVLSGFASMASKSVTIPVKFGLNAAAALRDINLGLRPAVALMDRIVARGSGLEAIEKSFSSLTGLAGKRSEYAARALQGATFQTLRWGEAMRQANKAIGDDIPLQKLTGIFRFATLKAAAEGEQVQGVLSNLIAGLGIGSARVLKQLGLDLGDVEERYARIKGVGAFDELPFAERKAVIIAEATRKMAEEQKKFGLTGRESGFAWQGIKTQIGDAVDKLTLAAVKSSSVRDALGGVRNVLGGITRHLESGGSIGDILFGKKGGQSGGIFGILKGGMIDLGEAFGRGALYALAKGAGGFLQILGGWAGSLTQMFVSAWDKLKPSIVSTFNDLPRIGREFGGAVVQGLRGGLKAAMDELPEPVRRFFQLDQFKTDHSGERFTTTQPSSAPPIFSPTTQSAGMSRSFPPKSLSDWGSLGAHLLDANLGRLLRAYQMSFGIDDWNREIGGVFPGQEIDRRSGYPITRGPTLNPNLFAMQALGSSAMGSFGIGDSLKRPADWAQPWGEKVLYALTNPLKVVATGIGKVTDTGAALSKYADSIVAKGLLPGGSRARDQYGKFLGDYPSGITASLSQIGINPEEYALDPRGRMLLKREESQARHELARIQRGDFGIRQQAQRNANAAVAKLRSENRSVSLGDRRRIFQEHYAKLRKQAGVPVRQRLTEIGDEMDSDARAREIQRRVRRLMFGGDQELNEHIARRVREGAMEEFERTGRISTPQDLKKQIGHDEIIRGRQREGDWFDKVTPRDIEMRREYEAKYGRGGFAHRTRESLDGTLAQVGPAAKGEQVAEQLVKSSGDVVSEIRELRKDLKSAVAEIGAAASGLPRK